MLALAKYIKQNVAMSKNELPPIQAWFVPRFTPFGSAPLHIKEQWVDVPLPLRHLTGEPSVYFTHDLYDILDVDVIDEGVDVYAFDAVKALTIFGKHEAA